MEIVKLKIIDFGKNTYQYGIQFKFDCIQLDITTHLVEDFLIKKRHFSNVSKDANTNQTILARGDGTQKEPFYNLRVGKDVVILWAGWHVPYDKWIHWRNSISSEVTELFQKIPIEFIATLSSQSSFVIPENNFKRWEEVPALNGLFAFYKRFLPEDILKRANSLTTFGNENWNRTVELWSSGGPNPGENNTTYTIRQSLLDNKMNLQHNLESHMKVSDKLLEDFHSAFLSLVIK